MTITLRPETPEDEPFLRRMIIDTVAAQLGAASWPEPMRTHLLGIQYSGRRQSHRAEFPGAQSRMIQTDGTDAGYVVVADTADEMHIVDIMVSSEFRGTGIGTAVIREILDTAGKAGKPVRLSVNVMNPGALRLYERLGFRRTGGDDAQHLMECPPASASQS